MLDFICIGSGELFGTDKERKIQNENMCLQRESNPRHATRRQVNQHFRPLGHDALMIIGGLMSYRIVGYKLIKPLYDNMYQIDYGYMCFSIVRLNLHFLSQCRF